jgi:hypothetical protein
MTIAERADRLEREHGFTLEDYPYTDADYRRIKRLDGLDKLRGVKDQRYRKTLWALYWVVLAIHGKAPSDEWRMGDDDFDTSSPQLPPEVNGVLQAEWDGFNKKMDRWAARRYRETGVMVSDSEKREHTTRFAAICRKRYGASYPTRSTVESA